MMNLFWFNVHVIPLINSAINASAFKILILETTQHLY